MGCQSGYVFGECTWFCAGKAAWIPCGLGDAGDWAFRWSQMGGAVTMTPTPNSVVSYCRGDGYSSYGHCGLVLQVAPDGTFLVWEMNFVAFDVDDQRWSNLGDVCGFLLAPGASPGGGGTGRGGGAQAPWDVAASWSAIQDYLNVRAELQVRHLMDLRALFDQV